MSDIRFNQWLHQSGTGGVSQDHIGNIGIGTTNPSIVVSAANTAVLNVGVITANNLFVNNAFNGDITGNVTGNISGATGTFSGNVDIADKIIHTGDTDTAMRFPADNTFSVDTAGSERIRITSDGNLGINTTTFAANGTNLKVSDGTISRLALDKTGANARKFEIGNFGTGLNVYDVTADAERLRITSGGLVGVNCTPLAQFQVKAGTNQNIALSSMSSEASIEAFNDAGSANVPLRLRGEDFKFYTSSTERLRITSTARFGFNTAIPPRDYCFHSGQADTNIQITNNTTGVDDSAGALIQQDGNDLYIWNKENSFMSLGTNATEKVRITSDGKMGVGTGSPSSLIHGRVSSGSAIATLESTATSGEASVSLKGKNSSGTVRTGIFKYDNSDMFRIGTTAGIPIRFETDDAERFRIAGNGQATFDKGAPGGSNQVIARFQAESSRRLDIVWHDSGSLMGFDTPSTHSYLFKCGGVEKFRITPDGRCGFNDSTGGYAETLQVTSRSSQGQYGIAIKIQNNSGYFMRFSNGTNAPCGSVSSSGGNATSFNTQWSDSRRKKNFENWNEEVLPLFKTLEPKKFNFTHEDDGSEKTKGYVAQDVVNKFPEAYPLLDDTEGDEQRYMFNPSGMTVYLMKALQEEIAKREALEARIAALEG